MVSTHAGITLSKEQVRRGTELAAEQGVPNAHFQVTHQLIYDLCAQYKQAVTITLYSVIHGIRRIGQNMNAAMHMRR